MDLQVFQIDMSRDTQRVKFMPLETAMQRTGEVDASIYQKVFDGELDCDDLEEAYEILNSEPPPSYHRPPAVSLRRDQNDGRLFLLRFL